MQVAQLARSIEIIQFLVAIKTIPPTSFWPLPFYFRFFIAKLRKSSVKSQKINKAIRSKSLNYLSYFRG
jgi:hypothetical protein